MTYTEYPPHPDLIPYIKCFWSYSSDKASSENPNIIIPDNCSDILIDIDGDGKALSSFIGTMTRPIHSAKKSVIGIRFRPGYAYAFFGIPMSEFSNTIVQLDDFWDGARQLEDGIRSLGNVVQQINYLQAMLMINRERTLHLDIRFQVALHKMAEYSAHNSIETISLGLGLSRQHLRRLFQKYVGINPIQFLKIDRVIRVIEYLRQQKGPVNLSHIAYDFGYYDQSHMNMDFRKMTTSPPSAFLRNNP